MRDVDLSTVDLQDEILHHLTYTLGKDSPHANRYDWRMALSYTIRDRIVGPWFTSTRRTWAEDRKRVYYLSMEYLIGRLLEDATINLGLNETVEKALAALGQDFHALIADEPDAALGNGGLGRLAACFMDSMATLGCPAYGYGIRYEYGLFRQRFEGGRQVETPEEWLKLADPWEFPRPESAYVVGFGGHVETRDGRAIWHPAETVIAEAHDTPVIGWQAKWANTLRLWAAKPTTQFDLDRFNRGDYTAAAEPEILARTLSRVLYPDDRTYQGKELRLKQEYFLTSAALQDILRRYLADHDDLAALPDHAAIQMNDTHPAIAGPELVRLLHDEHGMDFDQAIDTARACLGYTNHTLLPEALERWATFTFGTVLPRHMQIVQQIDAWHQKHHGGSKRTAIVADDQVRMGALAFIMSHRVNGVSALHSGLVKKELFPELDALHPGRIINMTNGVTPRRWLRLANPELARLITDAIGPGWESDLDRLTGIERHVEDSTFRAELARVKRANKARVAEWSERTLGVPLSPDALFDIQIKRIHEYKRQLMNILQAISDWHLLHTGAIADPVPRVKIFGGKAAPGYAAAKEIIRLINDVAAVINADPKTRDFLRIIYPPNYNVSMAQILVPAADLSEQISTAGAEASGTGNMKFMMNGALTIGTLDGANVEIHERVGDENFFLFGLTADQVETESATPGHERRAIAMSAPLRDVLQMIAEGRFSPDEPDRYHGLLNRIWNHDHFLITSDFEAYRLRQRDVDRAYRDQERWLRMAGRNIARSGFFSSDRTIRGYMKEIWNISSAL